MSDTSPIGRTIAWSTPRVALRQFEDTDDRFYIELCTSLVGGRLFRFSGAGIHPRAREAAIHDGILVHLVGVGQNTRRRLGVVSLGSADHRNGTAYLSAIAHESVRGSGLMVETVLLALSYAFETWPLRKIYLETPEYNLRTFRSARGRFFETEGILKSHVFLDNQFWDVHILTMTRDSWDQRGVPMLRRLARIG